MGARERSRRPEGPARVGDGAGPEAPEAPGGRRQRRVGRILRVAVVVVVVAVTLWVLFTVVFPWVEVLLDDPTLGAGG